MKISVFSFVIFTFLFTVFCSSICKGDNETYGYVHYEMLENGEVLHFWNEYYDYYINATSGIQLTNHYDEYWSKNVFCGGVKFGGSWDYYCTDSLSLDGTMIDSDNETYFNATGWMNLQMWQGGKLYKVRYFIQYVLNQEDTNLTVNMAVRNVGVNDIPVDLGFAWVIKDIQIGGNEENDFLYINNTVFNLDDVFEVNYTTLPETKLYLGDDITGENLWLSWNNNLTYKLQTNNNFEALGITIGTLDVGQQKETSMYWIDALCSWSCNMVLPSTNPDIDVGQTFMAEYNIPYDGRCISTNGNAELQYDNGTGWSAVDDDTELSIGAVDANPKSCIGSGGNCGDDWIVTGETNGTFQVRMSCHFNNRILPKNSGNQTVIVNPIGLGTCNFVDVSSDVTLTENNASCINITTDNVVFDCDGYNMTGTQQPTYQTFKTVGTNNVTIKNCNIWNHPLGIFVNQTNNFKSLNNTIQNGSIIQATEATSYGVMILNSEHSLVENTSIYDMWSNNTNPVAVSNAYFGGVFLDYANYTNVTDVTCHNITGVRTYSSEGFYFSEDYGSCLLYDRSNETKIWGMNSNLTGGAYAIRYFSQLGGGNIWINDSYIYNGSIWMVGDNQYAYNNTIINPRTKCITSTYGNTWMVGNNCSYIPASSQCFDDYQNDVFNLYDNYCDMNYMSDSGYYGTVNNADVRNNVFVNAQGTSTFSGIIYVGGKTGISIVNNTFINFNLTGLRSGAVTFYSNDILVENNTFINGVGDSYGMVVALYSTDLKNITMTNVKNSFYIYGSGANEISCIDCTFNKSSVFFESSTNFSAKYSARVSVTDGSSPLVSDVNITSNNGTLVEDATDGTGLTDWIVWQEYNQNESGVYIEGCVTGGNFTCLSPFNITVDNGSESNTTFYNLTAPYTTWNIILYGGAVDPCLYTSGDFTYQCSDNCVIDEFDAGGSSIFVDGAGRFKWVRNITNADLIMIRGGCEALW